MKENYIINNRPVVFGALSLMAGIATSLLVRDKIVFFLVIVAVFVLISIICLNLPNKKHIALFFLAFLIGFCGHFIQYKLAVKEFSGEENCFIEATVSKINRSDGYSNIILKDIKVDGFKVKGHALLQEKENTYKAFDIITFYGKISNKEIKLTNSSSLTYYGNGIYYDSKILILMEHTQTNKGLFGTLRNRMTSPMEGHLTEENKGIAYSLLFGDLSNLSGEDASAIRASGLSHIFAVSGLHISFVVGLIALLMKKLRTNKWLSLLFTSCVLFIYCGITGFPPSAIRASIMAFLYLISVAIYRKLDGLSALALAASAILVFSPRTLFSLSFIMSVSAVLGILLFYKCIYKYFIRKSSNKFRKYTSGALALSLSANIFLLPISMNVFGTISVYFMFANLIMLPLVMVCYVFMFLTSVLCIFSQWFGFLFLLGNLFIEGIRLVSVGVSLLPFSVISTSGLGVFTIAYVLIMVLLSRYILLSKSQKLTGTILIMFLGIFIMIII